MKEGQKLWTRDELILAINLYCKLPFGRLHRLNPDVINLANLIGRTPSSVAYKLVNFASLDPSLKARGIKGASNASNLDRIIWDEFYNNWDILPYESEKLLANYENTTVEKLNHIPEDELPKEGKTREQIVKVRVNQSFFRGLILSSYNSCCCITGIQQPEFLIAGHIRPWGLDEKNRLNPRNGVAMNALHDKAFDAGLITFSENYSVIISNATSEHSKKYLERHEGRSLRLPSRFLPSQEFLKYHRETVFRA